MQACVHPKLNDIHNETFASTYILFLSKSRFTLAYKNKQTNKQTSTQRRDSQNPNFSHTEL